MKIVVAVLSSLVLVASGFTTTTNSFGRRTSSQLSMSSALIVQNKGGGHGELGFQLAKTLTSSYSNRITSITILQDDACKDSAEPFCSYASDLPDVKVIKAPLSSQELTSDAVKAALGNQAFEYIWDNCSKGATGSGKAIVDCAKDWNSKLLTYVSSAGAYVPEGGVSFFPMDEFRTPVKDSSGQIQYENYAKSLGLPFVTFRPQYIYGPNSNKHDYVDWYLDRLVRELPLPIPFSGAQLVSITNSQDVASLLASVLNNEAGAVEQCVFNCGTDQLLSYSEVAYICAEALGIPKEKVDIYLYDGKDFGKGKFPFRLTDFYVSPDAAKKVLGWPGPQHSLAEDLKEFYVDSYKAREGPTRHVDFGKDWEIVVGHLPSLLGTDNIYDKWDPLIVETEGAQPLIRDMK